MHDAGGTGVDQNRNGQFPANPDDIGGTVNIDALVIIRITPDAGFASGMNNCLAPCCGVSQFIQRSNTALLRENAMFKQVLGDTALKSNNLVTLCGELPADRTSEESTATGNQYLQWLALHFFGCPLRQFFTANLGVVPD